VGTSKNQCSCRKWGALDRKVLSLFTIFKGLAPMNTASILAHSYHDDTVTMSLGPPYVTLKLLPIESEGLASSETTLIFLIPNEETTPEIWHTTNRCQSALQITEAAAYTK